MLAVEVHGTAPCAAWRAPRTHARQGDYPPPLFRSRAKLRTTPGLITAREFEICLDRESSRSHDASPQLLVPQRSDSNSHILRYASGTARPGIPPLPGGVRMRERWPPTSPVEAASIPSCDMGTKHPATRFGACSYRIDPRSTAALSEPQKRINDVSKTLCARFCLPGPSYPRVGA